MKTNMAKYNTEQPWACRKMNVMTNEASAVSKGVLYSCYSHLVLSSFSPNERHFNLFLKCKPPMMLL